MIAFLFVITFAPAVNAGWGNWLTSLADAPTSEPTFTSVETSCLDTIEWCRDPHHFMYPNCGNWVEGETPAPTTSDFDPTTCQDLYNMIDQNDCILQAFRSTDAPCAGVPVPEYNTHSLNVLEASVACKRFSMAQLECVSLFSVLDPTLDDVNAAVDCILKKAGRREYKHNKDAQLCLKTPKPSTVASTNAETNDEPTARPTLSGMVQKEPTALPTLSGMVHVPTSRPTLSGMVHKEPTSLPTLSGMVLKPKFGSTTHGSQNTNGVFRDPVDCPCPPYCHCPLATPVAAPKIGEEHGDNNDQIPFIPMATGNSNDAGSNPTPTPTVSFADLVKILDHLPKACGEALTKELSETTSCWTDPRQYPSCLFEGDANRDAEIASFRIDVQGVCSLVGKKFFKEWMANWFQINKEDEGQRMVGSSTYSQKYQDVVANTNSGNNPVDCTSWFCPCSTTTCRGRRLLTGGSSGNTIEKQTDKIPFIPMMAAAKIPSDATCIDVIDWCSDPANFMVKDCPNFSTAKDFNPVTCMNVYTVDGQSDCLVRAFRTPSSPCSTIPLPVGTPPLLISNELLDLMTNEVACENFSFANKLCVDEWSVLNPTTEDEIRAFKCIIDAAKQPEFAEDDDAKACLEVEPLLPGLGNASVKVPYTMAADGGKIPLGATWGPLFPRATSAPLATGNSNNVDASNHPVDCTSWFCPCSTTTCRGRRLLTTGGSAHSGNTIEKQTDRIPFIPMMAAATVPSDPTCADVLDWCLDSYNFMVKDCPNFSTAKDFDPHTCQNLYTVLGQNDCIVRAFHGQMDEDPCANVKLPYGDFDEEAIEMDAASVACENFSFANGLCVDEFSKLNPSDEDYVDAFKCIFDAAKQPKFAEDDYAKECLKFKAMLKWGF